MNQLNEEQKRLLIGNFYSENKEKGKPYTVNHFIKMGLQARSIYRIIDRVDNNISLKRRPGSGRKPYKMSHKKIDNLINKVDGKTGVSQQKLALNYGITQQYVSKIVRWHGIKYYKRKTKPKTTPEQEIKIKQRLIRLSKSELMPSNDLDVVMDDETYFTFSGEKHVGNSGYYSKDKTQVDPEVKYKSKSKFPQKLLVWLAISERGHSKPYFAQKNCAINSKTYSEKCITKRLVPYLQEYHNNSSYVFWPDGASAHYGKTTIETFERFNINYIRRENNPPNVPQLRPIEKLWGILKSRVYENNWEAKNVEHLKSRIRKKLSEISPETLKSLMSKVKTNVRKAVDFGANFMLN
jgi:transposase